MCHFILYNFIGLCLYKENLIFCVKYFVQLDTIQNINTNNIKKEEIYFQQNEAYNSKNVKSYLHAIFENRVISTHELI